MANTPKKIDSDCITAALGKLYSQHNEGEVFITDKVSFLMKNVLKRARKNYLGVYDKPFDSVTKEEKYFAPLTEAFTDGVIKSIDFDTKDIDLFSLNGTDIGAVRIMKSVLKAKLHQARFGETLNEFSRFLCIDGTGIIKFIDDYDPIKKKRVMKFRAVDNLNIIADNSADSLTDCFGVLERCLMNDSELRGKKGIWWDDAIDKVIKGGSKENASFTRYGYNIGSSLVQSVGPMYAIYDYWGQMELSDLTGKESDEDKWVEAHAVVANIDSEGKRVLLFAEENKKGIRPYVDCSLKKVIGRRIGRGIPEMLFGTQRYMNMLIEIRKKNAQILQNGLFKAKKGMGLTADTIISKLTVGGIIQVEEQDDFEQMPIQDSRASSYSDEDRLLQWGQRNTGAYDIQRGEALAASAPATSALIQDRNSRDIFQLVQENIGLMLERLILTHVIPWIQENLSDGEIVMITGSVKDLDDLDDTITEHLVNKAFVDYVEKAKAYPSDPETWLASAFQKQKAALKRMGNRRYIQWDTRAVNCEYGVVVNTTNESVDKATIATKLQEVLTLSVNAPQLGLDPQGIVESIFDVLNIPIDRVVSERPEFKTPIEKIIERKAMQAKAQQMMQQQQRSPAQQQASAMAGLTGKVAPQQNASVPTGTGLPKAVTQNQDNLTQLSG